MGTRRDNFRIVYTLLEVEANDLTSKISVLRIVIMDRSRPGFRPRFLSFFRQFIPPRHIHPSSSVSGGSTDAVGDTNQQRVSRFPHSP